MQHKSLSIRKLGLVILFLILLGTVYQVSASAQQAPAEKVARAWELAAQSGVYGFDIRIQQVTSPLPMLANVGLSPRQQEVFIAGTVDKPAETMQMAMYTGDAAVGAQKEDWELLVKEGQAFGRTQGQDWQKVDNFSDMFAPGGDPLGFLAAAKNIQEMGTFQVAVPSTSNPAETQMVVYTRYSYEVNGPAFARYMRDLTEEQLRETGKLPRSMKLDTARQYVLMTGSGEIWVDAEGLPLRQVISLEFPPDAYNQMSAYITTDFKDWASPEQTAVAALVQGDFQGLWGAVRRWAVPFLDGVETAAVPASIITASLIMGLAAWKLFGSKLVYAGLVGVIIFSMVVTPLVETSQVRAFSEEQQIELDAAKEQEELDQRQNQANALLLEDNYDPHQDPQTRGMLVNALKYTMQDVGNPDAPRSTPDSNRTISVGELPSRSGPAKDDDLDGVEDSIETPELLGTSPMKKDSDGDGLDDGVETYKLLSDPTKKDTDDDGIEDGVEARGFSYNNQMWYLNPNDKDTNNDEQPDNLECPNGTDCPDTDNDGTPDAFDEDNDGDQIPDWVDATPNGAVGTASQPLQDFSFQVSQLTPGKRVYVDFQLRPANPKHLWQAMNVLDWQSNDRQGQIMSVNNTTYAAWNDLEGRGSTPKDANGDMKLIPMLEVILNVGPGNYAGLPTVPGVSTDSTSTALIDWLDYAEMDSYGISVKWLEQNKKVIAFVPVSVTRDKFGTGIVAFNAQMPFFPALNNTTAAGNIRLIWLVRVLADNCPVPDNINRDEYCAGSTNWITGETTAHTYYDDWYLTGLNVREDHGVTAAIIHENPDLPGRGRQVDFEGYLWQLARGLEQTFMAGRQDMDINAVKARFDIGSSATSQQTWGIPQNALDVHLFNFATYPEMATIPMTHTQQILADAFQNPDLSAKASDPTLLYLREERSRTITLATGGGSVNSTFIKNNQPSSIVYTPVCGPDRPDGCYSGSANIQFSNAAAPLQTIVGMNWAPFRYEGVGVWSAYPIDEYYTNLSSQLDDAFTSLYPAGEQILVDGKDLTIEGQKALAINYYLSLNVGVTTLRVLGGKPITLNPSQPDEKIKPFDPTELFGTAKSIVESLGGAAAAQIQSEALKWAQDTAFIGHFSIQQKFFAGLGAFTFKNFKDSLMDFEGDFIYEAISTKSPAAAGIVAGGAMLAGFALSTASAFLNGTVKDVVNYTKTSLGVILKVQEIVKLANEFRSYLKTLSRGLEASLKASSLGAVVFGAIVSAAVSIGMFMFSVFAGGLEPGSEAFTRALIILVLTLIVAVIMLVISQIPIIGPLVLAIVALIDGIIALFCYAFGASGGVCNGLVAAAIAAVVNFFYPEAIPVPDIQHKDRLAIANLDVDPIKPEVGFTTANNLKVCMDIYHTQYLNKKSDRPNDLKDSTYVYQLQLVPSVKAGVDIHKDLKRKTMNWTVWQGQVCQDSICVKTFRAYLGLTPTSLISQLFKPVKTGTANSFLQSEPINKCTQVSLPNAGANSNIPTIILAEGHAISKVRTWNIGVAKVRKEETGRDTVHINVSENIIFDIFPRDLGGFFSYSSYYAYYYMDWVPKDSRPDSDILADADGDGLRARQDPNDTSPDSDGDGFSDYDEILYGSNPFAADADNDGLGDYDEMRYGTNPNWPDYDGDGLRDGLEVQGWLHTVAYDAQGNPLRIFVTSDPKASDTDGDGANDNLEYIYKTHPRNPHSAVLMSLSTTVLDDGFAKPGDTIAFATEVEHNLDFPVEGYLQTAFSAGTPAFQKVPFTINANEIKAISGSFQVNPSITTSQAVTMTQTAGGRGASWAIGGPAQEPVVGRNYGLSFDEGPGTQVFEQSIESYLDYKWQMSGSGNYATCTGSQCPLAGLPGQVFQGVVFDGVDDRVVLPYNPTMAPWESANDPSANMMVSFWVKPDGTGGNQVLLEQKDVLRVTLEGTTRHLNVQLYGWDGVEDNPSQGACSRISLWTGYKLTPVLYPNQWNHISIFVQNWSYPQPGGWTAINNQATGTIPITNYTIASVYLNGFKVYGGVGGQTIANVVVVNNKAKVIGFKQRGFEDGMFEFSTFFTAETRGSEVLQRGICPSTEPLYIGASASGQQNFSGMLDDINFGFSKDIYTVVNQQDVDDPLARGGGGFLLPLHKYQTAWFQNTNNINIVVDADKPSIALAGSGENLPARDTILAFETSDEATFVEKVEYRINGGSWMDAVQDGEAWVFPFSPTPNVSASYTLHMRATDSVGNQSPVASTTLTTDATVPTGSIGAARLAGSRTAGPIRPNSSGVLEFEVSYSDNSSEITAYADLLNGDQVPVVAPQLISLGGNGSQTIAIALPVEINHGLYTPRLLLEDQNGNRTIITGTETVIDPFGPNVVVTHGQGDTGSPAGLLGQASGAFIPSNPEFLLFFEEIGSVVSFADAAPGNQDGSCLGSTCPTETSGVFGRARSFDGVDDMIRTDASLSGVGGFSISAWIKTSASQEQVILQQKQVNIENGILQLKMLANGTLNFYTYADGENGAQVTSSQSINDGGWHHVVVVREEDGTSQLFIDGALAASAVGSPRPLFSAPLEMGGSSGTFFNGQLDEVMTFSRPLSREEISSMSLSDSGAGVTQVWVHLHNAASPELPVPEIQLAFEEPVSSVDFFDSAGQRQDGTCGSACPTAGSTGKFGSAITLNGTSQSVIVEDGGVSGTGAFAVSAWVKTSASQQQILLSQRTPEVLNGVWQLLMNPNGTLHFYSYGDSQYGFQITTATSINDGAWHHVAAVRSANGTGAIYIDGVLAGSASAPARTLVDTSVSLGVDLASSQGYFNGQMDEVTIFDADLSSAQVAVLADASFWRSATLSSPSSLFSSWSYALPAGLEGIYRVSARAADSLGSVRENPDAWSGVLDTLAPRVTFQANVLGPLMYVTRLEVADFSMLPADSAFPGTSLDKGQVRSLFYDQAWYTTLFQAPRLNGLTNQALNSSNFLPFAAATPPGNQLQVCDALNNCTSQALTGIQASAEIKVFTVEGKEGSVTEDVNSNYRVQKFSDTGSFLAQFGSFDDANVDARIQDPVDMDMDGQGNIYILDAFSDKIKKFSPSGAYLTSWSVPTTATGIGVDKLGTVYLADNTSNGGIMKYSTNGTLLAGIGYGTPCRSVDSEIRCSPPKIRFTQDVAVSSDGSTVYGISSYIFGRVFLFTSSGSLLGSFTTYLDSKEIVVDPVDNLYLFTPGGAFVDKYSSGGTSLTSWQVPDSGLGDIAVDSLGYVYLQVYSDTATTTIIKYDGNGTPITSWGADGLGSGQLRYARGIAATRESCLVGLTCTSLSRQILSTTDPLALASATAVISSTNPITLTAYFSAPNGIKQYSLDIVNAGGSSSNVTTGSYPLTTTTSLLVESAWVPPGSGVYQFTAGVLDHAGLFASAFPVTITVDTIPPVAALEGSTLDSSQLSDEGTLQLSGTASDNIALQRLQAQVGDGPWQDIPLPTSGNTWAATLFHNQPSLPDGSSLTVTLRATDQAGWQTDAVLVYTADANGPQIPNMGVTYNGPMGETGVSPFASIHDTLDPTLNITWTASSDPSGISHYLAGWTITNTLESSDYAQLTTVVSTVLTYSQVLTDGQALYAHVVAVDNFSNTSSAVLGPFYIDYQETPDLVDMDAFGGAPYRGWMADACSLVGVDNRINLAPQGVSTQIQRLFLTWNQDGLRLSWLGGDWSAEGDLFLYFNTTSGGSSIAYDPYTSTITNTLVYLPFQADYLLYISMDDEESSSNAALLNWNGSEWVSSGGSWELVFDADGEITDIFLPFADLSIGDPANTSLEMVGFATEEASLRLWAAIPNYNILNSSLVSGAAGGGPSATDFHLFSLQQSYSTPNLGNGACPAETANLGQIDAAWQATTQAGDSAGINYAWLGDYLFNLMPLLAEFEGSQDWDTPLAGMCASYPDAVLCQRIPTTQQTGLDYNPLTTQDKAPEELPAPLGDGEILTVTLVVENTGDGLMESARVELETWGALVLPAGTYSSAGPDQWYTQSIALGDLDPGDTLTITFQVIVDADLDNQSGWATLTALLENNLGTPLEIMNLDFQVDFAPPSFLAVVEPQGPLTNGLNTIYGTVIDASPVPTIELEISGGGLRTAVQTCFDSVPEDSFWNCEIDLSALVNGDQVSIRARAIDIFGQTSQWTDEFSTAAQFVVDSQAPVVALSDDTQSFFASGTLVGNDLVIAGSITDNQAIDRVEVCEVLETGQNCANAEIISGTLGSTVLTGYVYEDVPETPAPITAATFCSGGEILRSFDVTDNFTIAELNIGLVFDHSFRDDLVISLTAPDATTIVLVDGASAAAGLNVLLSDFAAFPLWSDLSIHQPAAPFYTHLLAPAEQLSTLNGMNASGTWTLSICDREPALDDGEYLRSQLIFTAVERDPAAAQWSFSRDLPSEDGENLHTYLVTGYDSLGLRSSPAITLSFTVDNLSPVLTVNPPSRAEAVLPLSGSVSDGSGVASLVIWGQNQDGDARSESIPLTDPEWTFSGEAFFFGGGSYTLTLQAADIHGNVRQSEPYTISQPTYPVASFTAAEYLVREDAGSVAITVTLDLTPSAPTVITATTLSGSAIGGSGGSGDYTTTSTQLVFGTGVTQTTFTVPVIDDGIPENWSEVFTILLTPGGNSYIGTPTAEVRILDPDGIIYVNDDAPGLDNGTSWLDAFTSLDEALFYATHGQQVWVAAGRYVPVTFNPAYTQTSIVQATFSLVDGVALYGGFSGTETQLSERDWEANLTLLSGDLDDDDITNASGIITQTGILTVTPGVTPTIRITGTNSLHVVTVYNAGTGTVLDGFTITGGVAYLPYQGLPCVGCGGGLSIENSNVTLANLHLIGNYALWGGGLFAYNSTLSLSNLHFENNEANLYGGGLYAQAATLALDGSVFTGNAVLFDGGGLALIESSALLDEVELNANRAGDLGGGLYSEQSALVMDDTIVVSNTAYSGGGVYMDGTPDARQSLEVVNTTFEYNTAVYLGGGLMITNTQSAYLASLSFNANTAEWGGGLYQDGSSTTLESSIFVNNTATQGGGAIYNWYSSAAIHNSDFTENVCANPCDWGGGAIGNVESTPTIIGSTFIRNQATYGGGITDWSFVDAVYQDLLFQENYASVEGGAIYIGSSSDAVFTNTRFVGNAANSTAGVFQWEGQTSFYQVSFVGNQADWTSALQVDSGQTVLTQVTFAGNRAEYSAGAVELENSSILTLTNSILYNNTLAGNPHDLLLPSGSTADISNTLINANCAGVNITCSGVLTGDPLFVRNPDAGDGDWSSFADNDYGDLHLQFASQAIDAGDNAYVKDDSDLEGLPRITDGDGDGVSRVDLGVYEAPPAVILVNASAANQRAAVANGITWTTAFTNVQDALSYAIPGSQIWVAEGVYYPDEGAGQTDNLETSTFQLTSGIAIYGGFAGTETRLDQRNWRAHPTILSGDLTQDDEVENGITLSPADVRGSNAYHVVTGSGANSSAILDGFTITGGSAFGGFSSPCAYSCGGGLYNHSGSPTLRQIDFYGNSASYRGGALFNYASSPTLTHVRFFQNEADEGGAVFTGIASNPTFTNAEFYGNQAVLIGGALYTNFGTLTLANATLVGNHALVSGGGLYNANGASPLVHNSILWGNTANTSGPQIFNADTAAPTFRSSLVEGSGGSDAWSLDYGVNGGGNLDEDPLFLNPTGPVVDLHLSSASPAVDAGDDSLVTTASDLDGNPRIYGAAVDMGVYERPPALLFVDDTALGPQHDGLTWTTAFTNVQDALNWAIAGTMVWVAEGIYYPDEGGISSPDDPNSSFTLRDGVALYGGFTGTESNLDQRTDWQAHPTILSGDLEQDDPHESGVVTDTARITGINAIHVVQGSGTGAETRLDGFIITAGWAEEPWTGYPCGGCAGGLALENSLLTAANLRFQGNHATWGGAIFVYRGSPKLEEITFQGNTATSTGGGVNLEEAQLSMNNLVFQDNQADFGAGLYAYASTYTLTQGSFISNTAAWDGGGIYNETSLAVVEDSAFYGNRAIWGAALENWNDSHGRYSGLLIQENHASGQGGGIYVGSDSTAVFTDTWFLGNTGEDSGAVHVWQGSVSFTQVIFAGNAADRGGALTLVESEADLTHVTLSSNTATVRGGGIDLGTASVMRIANSILHGNIANTGPDIVNQAGGSAILTNTLVSTGCPSGNVVCEGVFSADPQFVLDPDAGDGDWSSSSDNSYGDLHLQASSPAIDQADPAYVATSTDLDGNPRTIGVEADLGVYESDYPTPSVQFSSSDYAAGEADGQVVITATLSGPTHLVVTVDYTTTLGTASISDYTPVSGTLSFDPGITTQVFQLAITDDVVKELAETVNLVLNNPVNASSGSPSTATLTISDNDDQPTVRFSTSSYTINEGLGTATITVTLSNPSGSSVTVNYTTTNDTASAPGDYTTTSGTLTFDPARQMQDGTLIQTFTVSINNDALDEVDEVINLNLSSPTNANLGSPSAATLTITDDDNPPTVRFSSSAYSVSEAAVNGTITATLSSPSGKPITVQYEATSVTALSPSDFTAVNGTLTFDPGQTEAVFSVSIVNDSLDEVNETVRLTLSNPTNATLGSPVIATLTIMDDDNPPEAYFSAAVYTSTENASSITITVTLSAASSKTVLIGFETEDGTAVAGTPGSGDYTSQSGTLTFAPLQISATITLELLNDGDYEGLENLWVNLTSFTNAVQGSPTSARIDLLEDDPEGFFIYLPLVKR